MKHVPNICLEEKTGVCVWGGVLQMAKLGGGGPANGQTEISCRLLPNFVEFSSA